MSLSESDIMSYLKDLENQSKNLKLEILKMCWYMRGGLTWQEALEMSPDEREIVSTLIKENLETTKKTGQPFF